MESEQPWDVRGKRVLVTGGNTGIGQATALELVRRGADVTITSRNAAKGEAARLAIQNAANDSDAGTIEVRELDLASFRSIDAFAERFLAEVPALHVLVHNAGLIQGERHETEDGFEVTFGTNHLGTFRLNQRLEALVRTSAPARIVVVASAAHRRTRKGLNFADLQSRQHYDAVQVYSDSKLANILFTRELAKRLEGSGVTANCLHPGVVATSFNSVGGHGGLWGFVFRWLKPLLLSPAKGARTSVYLCSEPSVAAVNGAYFSGCVETAPSRAALDDAAAKRLWEISEQLSQSPSLDRP